MNERIRRMRELGGGGEEKIKKKGTPSYVCELSYTFPNSIEEKCVRFFRCVGDFLLSCNYACRDHLNLRDRPENSRAFFFLLTSDRLERFLAEKKYGQSKG